jgi:transposase
MARGRPLLLTDKVQRQIIKAISQGAYIETAAAVAGIRKSTLYDWLRRGARERRRLAANRRARAKTKEMRFVRFSDAVEKALAEAELADLTIITKASQKTWQAAAWRLERKYPARYGQRFRLEHTGRKGAPPVKVEHGLSDEQADTIKRMVFGLVEAEDEPTPDAE